MSVELDNVVDGEWSGRTAAQEGLWVSIDALGTFRNICSGIGSAAEIVGATAAKVASVAGGAIVPITFILGGALVLGSAVVHTIPKALEECKGAKKDFEAAEKSGDPEKMKLAEEGTTVAALGLTNQSLFGLMGAGMVQCGVVTLMSPIGAHLFGFAPLVTGGAAAASGGALGGVYAVRGAVVVGRSVYNLHYLNQFENDFKASLTLRGETKEDVEESIKNAIEMIENIGTGTNALGRRIGESVPKLKDDASVGDKIRYLEAVDKGIQEKKLQQILGLIIGVAMILGGLAAIATVFVCPLALPIISLVSAIFFVAMESVYGTYDSSFLFGKLRDKLYKPSAEIAALKVAYGKSGLWALETSKSKSLKPRLKGLDLAIPESLQKWAQNRREGAQSARIKGGIHLIPTSFPPRQNGLKKTA